MVNANELRLGNYVDFQYGEIITVDGIDTIDVFNKQIGDIPLHSIYPIPLTEEILLKCGAIRENRHCDMQVYRIGKIEIGAIERADFYLKSCIDIDVPINHLHTFQNIYFALTGEELQINL